MTGAPQGLPLHNSKPQNLIGPSYYLHARWSTLDAPTPLIRLDVLNLSGASNPVIDLRASTSLQTAPSTVFSAADTGKVSIVAAPSGETTGMLAITNDTSGGLRKGIVSSGGGNSLTTYGNGAIGNGPCASLDCIYVGALINGIAGTAPTSTVAPIAAAINFTSANNAAASLFLRRAAAANLAQGGVDVASPVAQTIGVQNVSTGTSNTAGVNTTQDACQGTGTGNGGSHVYRVAAAGSAGSSQNALVSALTINSAGLLTLTGSNVLQSGTAIPAGGTAGAGLRVSSTSNFGVFFGSGAPTLSAAKGSWYLRSDGSSTTTRAYVNTDGATTWTPLTTVA